MPNKQISKPPIQSAGENDVFVEVSSELKIALSRDKEAKAAFDKLPPSHQKEYVTWINDAKKEETRQRRVAQTLEMLKKDKKSR